MSPITTPPDQQANQQAGHQANGEADKADDATLPRALAGRICVITGASRGIGYYAALELAKRGAHIVALARTQGGLEELDDEITINSLKPMS